MESKSPCIRINTNEWFIVEQTRYNSPKHTRLFWVQKRPRTTNLFNYFLMKPELVKASRRLAQLMETSCVSGIAELDISWEDIPVFLVALDHLWAQQSNPLMDAPEDPNTARLVEWLNTTA